MMLNARQRIKQRVHNREARGDAASADPASVIFGAGCVDEGVSDAIGDGSGNVGMINDRGKALFQFSVR
jgi:hypothetical protein